MARQSNIELLRVIATFFILIVHCNGWFLSSWGGVNDWFTNGYASGIWRIFVQSVSSSGVVLFVLISGWFGIKVKVKSLMNLFTSLLFIYSICYFANICLNDYGFSLKSFVARGLLAFSRENWFINSYLVMMLISPAINAFMEKVTPKQATLFITIFLLVALWFGCIRDEKYFGFNQGYSPLTLVMIYSVGRFLKLFLNVHLCQISNKILIVFYLLSLGLLSAAYFFKVDQLTWYCSPVLILSSSIFFILFSRMTIQSSIINWIAASTLAVYVLHTSSPIISMFARYDCEIFQTNGLVLWIAKMFCVIILVFGAAVLLDKLRLLIFKPLINLAGRIDDKISHLLVI